ncbi:hypothetical protein [Acholeplasma laidlawii]|uniref:hypothetical protein n=1 Tax=Acholeplasma laidlawii TaxID=2148 RepID=UPI0021F79492|nr:hypothetical protein [Acholeplasma laidlawii]
MFKAIGKLIGSAGTTITLLTAGPEILLKWFNYDISSWQEWIKITVFVLIICMGVAGIVLSFIFTDNEKEPEGATERVIDTVSGVTTGAVIGIIAATVVGAIFLTAVYKSKNK